MSVAYEPYEPYEPVSTTDLHALRTELIRCRNTYGRRSYHAARAYRALSDTANAQGQPLHGLRRHTANEVERFFAHTIAGPDRHVYWDGAKTFRRNDGRSRKPLRWWWEHKHGPLLRTDDIWMTCGAPNCICVDHATKGRSERRVIFKDEQMLGALQVLALRLGHTPTVVEWDHSGMSPTRAIFQRRFGSWSQAIAAAHLPPTPGARPKRTPAECRSAILLARKILNRWPTTTDFEKEPLRTRLRTANLPTRHGTIRDALGGSWAEALAKAGKR